MTAIRSLDCSRKKKGETSLSGIVWILRIAISDSGYCSTTDWVSKKLIVTAEDKYFFRGANVDSMEKELKKRYFLNKGRKWNFESFQKSYFKCRTKHIFHFFLLLILRAFHSFEDSRKTISSCTRLMHIQDQPIKSWEDHTELMTTKWFSIHIAYKNRHVTVFYRNSVYDHIKFFPTLRWWMSISWTRLYIIP